MTSKTRFVNQKIREMKNMIYGLERKSGQLFKLEGCTKIYEFYQALAEDLIPSFSLGSFFNSSLLQLGSGEFLLVSKYAEATIPEGTAKTPIPRSATREPSN